MSLGQTGTDIRLPLRAKVLQAGATLGGTFKYVNLFDANGNAQYPASIAVPVLIAASGAIAPGTPAYYLITKAGVAAMTLAAPIATTDDGKIIYVGSTTAFAHTITATGLLSTGSAAVNVATFAAFAGAGLTLMAYQGLWIVRSSVGVTFS